MRKNTPPATFSENERKLLHLFIRLITESLEQQELRNTPKEHIILDKEEADSLILLIDRLLEKREFIESSIFVENIGSLNTKNQKEVREIYLSNRKRKGRSRAMANNHWHDIQLRLGVSKTYLRGGAARPISAEEFIEMERKLFITLNFSTEIVNSLIDLVSSQKKNLKSLISNKKKLPSGSVKKVFLSIKNLASGKRTTPISSKKIYAAVTVLSNMATLFTTRDWSAIGTLSTMAGTAAVVFTPDSE